MQWKIDLLSQLDTVINDINNSNDNTSLKIAVKSMVFTSPPFEL